MLRLARLFTTSLLLAIAALAAASPAQAATTQISQGSLEWGVKESFRNYVTGGIAKGSISVTGGATQAAGNGAFTFPLRSGSYDSDAGATLALFDGSVRFYGHNGELDLTISDLRIELLDAGAFIVADVSTTTFPSTGPPATNEDVPLVQLDLTGKTPAVANGRTSWSELPAKLTSVAAPLFGGFYTPGTVFDSATLDYTGPGGVPVSEGFTKPATVGFGKGEEATGVSGYRLFRDEQRDVLHVVGGDGVRAYDLDTLELRGEKVLDPSDGYVIGQRGISFDPETGTVYGWRMIDNDSNGVPDDDDGDENYDEPEDMDGVPTDPGTVRAFTWDAANDTYDEETGNFPGATVTEYDTVADRLVMVSPDGSDVRFVKRSSAGTLTVEGGNPAIDTGSRTIASLKRTGAGALVGAYAAKLVSGRAVPQAAFSLKGAAGALTATDIPGTALAQPATGNSLGFTTIEAGPAGSIVLGESTFGAATPRIQRVVPSTTEPSGFARSGEPDLVPSLRSIAVNQTDGSVFVANGTAVALRRDGAEAGRFETDGTTLVEDGDDLLVHNPSDTSLVRWERTGVSPSLGTSPGDQRVELTAAGESRSVTFTASSSGGTPAPTVRWQRREPGQGAWTDVPGATSGSLEVNANTAASGNRYRAVFENAAGRIATQPAALVVTVRPAVAGPLPLPPQIGAPPAATAPSRTAAPRSVAARLSTRSLRASRGRIAFRVSSPRVRARTAITVRTRAKVRVGKKRKLVTVATGRVTLSATGSTLVKLRLTREGRALLKRVRSVTVVVKIAPRGVPATTRVVRLRG